MSRLILALFAVAAVVCIASATQAESPVPTAASVLSNYSMPYAPAYSARATFMKGNLRFACVQPPTACSSNSDCSCSGCCASWSGRGICQPSC